MTDDLEALRRGYEAWNRGDLSTVLALVDPDIEWRPGTDAKATGWYAYRSRDEAMAVSRSRTATRRCAPRKAAEPKKRLLL